LPVPRC
ncbi:hypothetical protein VCEC0051_003268B, partial [Vibrio cholerae O1 str. EC-0051]